MGVPAAPIFHHSQIPKQSAHFAKLGDAMAVALVSACYKSGGEIRYHELSCTARAALDKIGETNPFSAATD